MNLVKLFVIFLTALVLFRVIQTLLLKQNLSWVSLAPALALLKWLPDEGEDIYPDGMMNLNKCVCSISNVFICVILK